jgi:hypothetical protein
MQHAVQEYNVGRANHRLSAAVTNKRTAKQLTPSHAQAAGKYGSVVLYSLHR